jgi:hypothetical protein
MLRIRAFDMLWLLCFSLLILAGGPVFGQNVTNWKWIWAESKAPPDTVFFRQRFQLPKNIVSGRLQITADDNFSVYLNESKNAIAKGSDWTTVQEFEVTRFLRAGDNLLAIEAQNTSGVGGLLYKLTIQLPGNKKIQFVSDSKVRTNRTPPVAWKLFSENDSQWKSAVVIAPVNGGFWGPLHSAAQPDPKSLLRIWDLRGGVHSDDDPYTRARNIGDRMILSASVTNPTDMQILAQYGFTLFQTDSDHLSTDQIRPNVWSFSTQISARQSVERLGLDWCYFPHAAFPPEWYRKTTPFTRLQCLEHKQPVDAFSPWEPKWQDFIDRNYAALAHEFLPQAAPIPPKPKPQIQKQEPVSALYVGIHGDYGEAGFMVGARIQVPGQKEDWMHRFGNLHDHIGWWCDDALARADFRATMLQKYGSLAQLNLVWKRSFKTPDEIVYPVAPRVEARREWLDYVEWYQGEIGKAIEVNLSAARRHFPDTLLMLPAGFADENPRGGNDNSLIPKIASHYKADVRSTHGAFKPFADNAATMLGRLGSASRFYGAPFWTEPPGTLTANQEIERIFEAVSQGAKGHFDWASNALANRDVYYRYGKFLRVEKPVVDVAMFYPAAAQRLRPNEGYAPLFAQACAYVRDYANFDIVDDRMVLDGCLSNYRILVLWEGTMADQTTLDKIKEWVNDGGVLLAYDFGKVANFEGETPWYTDKDDLFGYIQDLAPAQIKERYVGTLPMQYRVQVGSPQAVDYLTDSVEGWYEPEVQDGITRRWTKAKASMRLPVNTAKQYTLVVRAYVPKEAANLSRHILINDQDIGQLGSPGDVTYRFFLPNSLIAGKPLTTLTFQSELFQPSKRIPESNDMRMIGVQILSVQLVEQGITEDANAMPPPGTIRRELDIGQFLATKWTHKVGKGLTIYFPANRKLLKGYIEVLRRVIYHLSSLEAGRRNALPIDDDLDGVYATLFTDKILYLNTKDTPVTKTVTIKGETFAAWKGEITIPEKNEWTLTIPPHGIEAIYFAPEPQELLFECEDFKELGSLKPVSAADCSPGTGLSCVPLPRGGSITTRLAIETPGRYAIYTRCIRGNRLEPVEVLVDGQQIVPVNAKAGQTLLSGTLLLTRGKHTLTLRARPMTDTRPNRPSAPEIPLRADFVLLTNDPTIAGYDFAVRFPPVE